MEFLDESYVDIVVRDGKEPKRIPVDDILYVNRENRKTTVFTVNEKYPLTVSFDDMVSKLPNTFFYLVHHSFLVNIHHITKYGYNEVYIGNIRIPVAPRKQSKFHTFWFEYVMR